jgi:hypothetical protein
MRTSTVFLIIVLLALILSGAVGIIADAAHPEPCRFRIPGDANGDGVVDILDFSLLATHYGTERGDDGYSADADFNCDGVIDDLDLDILTAFYGMALPCSVTTQIEPPTRTELRQGPRGVTR